MANALNAARREFCREQNLQSRLIELSTQATSLPRQAETQLSNRPSEQANPPASSLRRAAERRSVSFEPDNESQEDADGTFGTYDDDEYHSMTEDNNLNYWARD